LPITPQTFHYQLNQIITAENYLIAYSGGVDSHVLLHLCAQLKNMPGGSEQSFAAVYIDHGLNPHAKKWGRHCQHICYELDIPLTIVEVDATPDNGQSPEAAARLARYHAFAEILQTNECLLTAQHQDDQAETLLLQLLRGCGTRGLSAMPGLKQFSRGHLCRPILHYRKQDILAYAKQHHLEWIEDDSNYAERFDRNYLRHSIFPLLQHRWPAVMKNFSRSAELQAESQLLLEQLAKVDMHEALVYGHDNICETDKLLTEPLLALRSRYHDDIRLKNILRFWISSNHVPLPSKKILQEIIAAVLYAAEDANPRVCWNRDDFHGEVRKYRNKLYLLNSPPDEIKLDPQHHLLTMDRPLILEGSRGRIILEAYSAKQPNLQMNNQKMVSQKNTACTGFDKQQLLSRPISIVSRRGGERYRRSAEDFSHSLKHWFQEQAIPPWERQSMPLIYWGDELIQVGERVVNDSLISTDAENSLIILWNTNK
jgi:tRNA(Ile)-lysidine synthase